MDSFASMIGGLRLQWSIKGYSLGFILNYFSFCSNSLLCSNFGFFKTTKDSIESRECPPAGNTRCNDMPSLKANLIYLLIKFKCV